MQIQEFGSFTAAQIRNNETLQNITVNTTHHAIAQSAADNGIYRGDFWMNFFNVSGTVSIEYNMCSWYQLQLTALKYVIQNEDDEINYVISNHLNTSKTVAISVNKLGHAMMFTHAMLHTN